MIEFDPGLVFEPFHHEMTARADAPGGITQVLAGLGQLDQLLEVFDRQVGVDHDHVAAAAADAGDRRDVVERIDRRLEHQQLVGNRGSGEAHQQGIAVGRGAGDFCGGDHAGGAGFVVDHDIGAELLAEPLGHKSAEDVGAAAGAAWNDQADRFAGRPGGLGAGCGSGQCGAKGTQRSQHAAAMGGGDQRQSGFRFGHGVQVLEESSSKRGKRAQPFA